MFIDSWMDKEKCGIYTKWNIIPLLKEWNPVICGNMDGTGGHYFK
jgi:hypothetical protein